VKRAQGRPRLAFISPQFLFPNDAGGKIRTTNILRGLKGGAFEIVLVGVASAEQESQWRNELAGVCDEFKPWRPTQARSKLRRVLDLFRTLPVNVVQDQSAAGLRAIAEVAGSSDFDVLVFDFVHSAALMPAQLQTVSLCFTHNVEAEIFARHAKQAKNPLLRWVWASQHRKMKAFEAQALRRFNTVIAVSERDAGQFRSAYAVQDAKAIPTGVDLEFFAWQAAPAVDTRHPPTVVFTGSMDWAANIDGVRFFLEQVWPLVLQAEPTARFTVVGKAPPAALQQLAKQTRQVEFTGFVDDVRPYVHAAHAFVIPLLVGGGTRIKAFEAMAMGCPVLSTSIGIEGLSADADVHYLKRDDAAGFAAALLDLLRQPSLREQLSRQARQLVEQSFGHRKVAQVFEQICLDTLKGGVE